MFRERTAESGQRCCLQASAESECVYTMRDELNLNPFDIELTAPEQSEREKEIYSPKSVTPTQTSSDRLPHFVTIEITLPGSNVFLNILHGNSIQEGHNTAGSLY